MDLVPNTASTLVGGGTAPRLVLPGLGEDEIQRRAFTRAQPDRDGVLLQVVQKVKIELLALLSHRGH
jgi:hypothetical protein